MNLVRKKIILFESNLVLIDTLIFLFESTFNADVIRFDDYQSFYYYLKENEQEDNVFIFMGYLKNSSDRQKIYDLYIHKKLSSTCGFFDFSNDGFMKPQPESFPLILSRNTPFETILQVIKDSLTIDIAIPKLEFTPIAIKTFAYLDNMKHCVYLKLLSGRYIKLFQSYDIILDSDVEKYINKGVKFLYLKQDAFAWIYTQIERQHDLILQGIPVVLNDNDDPLNEEISDSIHSVNDFNLEEFNASNKINFNPAILDTVHIQLDNYKKILLSNMSIKKYFKMIKASLTDDNFGEKKILVLILIINEILKEMEWTNNNILDRFLYAAILHDIALEKYPHIIKLDALNKIAEINKLSESERNLYYNHPLIINEYIKLDPKIPKDFMDLIFRHHEQLDGSGFPAKCDHKKLNTMMVIFNMSNDVANLILTQDNTNYVDIIGQFKMSAKGGISRKVIAKFEQFFQKKLIA